MRLSPEFNPMAVRWLVQQSLNIVSLFLRTRCLLKDFIAWSIFFESLKVIFLSSLLILSFFKLPVNTGASSPALTTIVYVLEDSDPDFMNPPFEDRLTVINPADHTKVRTIAKFNIAAEWGGARRFLASIDSGLTCLIVNEASKQLLKYDFTKDEVSTVKSQSMHSVYVSESGDIFALTDGTIYGRTFIRMDQNGNIVKEEPYGGVNIVVDDDHDSVWIVGANITRLDRNLNKKFSMDPIAWAAFSVDFTSDGSVWVTESKYPQVAGSKTRLLKISINGEIVKTIDLAETPFYVSVDRSDDSFWLTTSRGLYKYDKNGNLMKQVETQRRWMVKVNQTDGSVWVAGYGDVKHYTRDGILIASITGFSSSPACVDFVTVRDTVAPTTTVNIGLPKYEKDKVIYVSGLTVFTLSASDDASGVRETRYRIDGAWTTYSSGFTLSGFSDGSHTISYYSVDNAGNTEAEKTLTIILDKTPPTISEASPTGTISSTSVSFTIKVEDSGSGVKEVKLIVDGASKGTMSVSGNTYSKTISLSEGSHTWVVETVDNVGNTATQKYSFTVSTWMSLLPYLTAIAIVIVIIATAAILLRRRKPTLPPPPPPPPP